MRRQGEREKRASAMGSDRPASELAVVASISEALNSSRDVQEALDRTLTLIADLLGLETGWVWLVDPDSGQYYSAASRNLPPYLQDPVRMTGSTCWCLEEFSNGELTPRNIDVIECSRLRPAVKANQTDLTRGLAHHASIPLYFRDKPLGIMNVTAPQLRPIAREELHLLSAVADQLGVAIERSRLAEEGARLARAEERSRLAREIHDTLAQGLTAIGLQIEEAMERMEGEPKKAREKLRQALETTRGSLEQARRSVLDLRPSPLEGRPLSSAIAALARSFTSDTGIGVTVRDRSAVSISPAAEAELYRIVQQALDNVRQHARAHRVEIDLRPAHDRVELRVHDDGAGFDVTRVPPDRHGLAGMDERARLVGGSMSITSVSEEGTTISVSIPAGTEPR